MVEQLKTAARDGVVLGVKYGLALLMVGAILTWMAGDYASTRQATLFLNQTVAGLTSPQGKPVTRADLIDATLRDYVQRTQPPPPAKGN
jgi:hypothetical protein